jgi:hypothetical protein
VRLQLSMFRVAAAANMLSVFESRWPPPRFTDPDQVPRA